MLLIIKNQSKRKEGEGDARWLLRKGKGKGKGKDARDLSVSICFDSCLSLFSTFQIGRAHV